MNHSLLMDCLFLQRMELNLSLKLPLIVGQIVKLKLLCYSHFLMEQHINWQVNIHVQIMCLIRTYYFQTFGLWIVNFILFTGSPDTMVSNTDGRQSFNAGGIKFQLIEAMRKWRILFNGLAKRTNSNGEVRRIWWGVNSSKLC